MTLVADDSKDKHVDNADRVMELFNNELDKVIRDRTPTPSSPTPSTSI
eukprot:CAMPEP_0197844584 /NCGR_PEP_ID=MMETSP1438-20131217/1587_1 /TAXON_ID=1461541 /ORGANISM="Pterosperma sp., Strain CCMP1384" /LENGTH=47 /DNA_ID= /DNA_START= /DNA_END= /DNA_ORIENTATION=